MAKGLQFFLPQSFVDSLLNLVVDNVVGCREAFQLREEIKEASNDSVEVDLVVFEDLQRNDVCTQSDFKHQ